MKAGDAKQEIDRLQAENELLKIKMKGLEDIAKSDPHKSELLKMLELGLEALRTGEFKGLRGKMEKISKRQIMNAWDEGGKAGVAKDKREIGKLGGSKKFAKLKDEAIRLSKNSRTDKPFDIAREIYLDVRRYADSNGLKKLSEKQEKRTIAGWVEESQKPKKI